MQLYTSLCYLLIETKQHLMIISSSIMPHINALESGGLISSA